MTKELAESDIRFLEYRLDVISFWPPSAAKKAATEAISRRLTDIARCALGKTGVEEVLAHCCRLLDDTFSAEDSVESSELQPAYAMGSR